MSGRKSLVFPLMLFASQCASSFFFLEPLQSQDIIWPSFVMLSYPRNIWHPKKKFLKFLFAQASLSRSEVLSKFSKKIINPSRIHFSTSCTVLFIIFYRESHFSWAACPLGPVSTACSLSFLIYCSAGTSLYSHFLNSDSPSFLVYQLILWLPINGYMAYNNQKALCLRKYSYFT